MDTLVICSRIPVAFTSTERKIEMATKLKTEPEEEVQPSTSGGSVPAEEPEKKDESEESLESDEIDDEYLFNYCETTEIIHPMTVSKELFIRTAWLLEILLDYQKKTRNVLTR